jgi:hypothetical protein
MAHHAEVATKLLVSLEQLDVKAHGALDNGRGTDFFTAIDEREAVLSKLSEVIDAFMRESIEARGSEVGSGIEVDADPIFAEMVHAAKAALESQQQLTARATRERNRLAAALHNTNRPDAIANQYAGAYGVRRSGTLSVTG